MFSAELDAARSPVRVPGPARPGSTCRRVLGPVQRNRRRRGIIAAAAVIVLCASTAITVVVVVVAAGPAAAATSVGAGSYTTDPVGPLPTGCSTISTNPRQYLTSNAPAGAIPTNDWWSSLVFKRLDCRYSEVLQAQARSPEVAACHRCTRDRR